MASRTHVFDACRNFNDLLDRAPTNEDKQSIALLRVGTENRCLGKPVELVGIAFSNIGFVQGGSKSSCVTFAVKLVGAGTSQSGNQLRFPRTHVLIKPQYFCGCIDTRIGPRSAEGTFIKDDHYNWHKQLKIVCPRCSSFPIAFPPSKPNIRWVNSACSLPCCS